MMEPAQTSRPDSPGAGRDEDAICIEARRHPLVAHIERQLYGRCRLEGPSKDDIKLVLGVSGGADSTALLLACAVIADHNRRSGLRLSPIAVHVHHHLRESADDDAIWVERLCSRLGIEVHVEHVQPAALPGNCSANARRLRYEALERVARRVGAKHLAVAHHADDQFETILMALCRGAGLDGLAGMPWRRELESGLFLIRPMLQTRRAEAEDLCRAAGLEWREDPGNLDPDSARGRLRRDVTPVLENLWPDSALRVSATGDLIEVARQTFEARLQIVFGEPDERQWVRRELAGLPEAIIAAGLRRAALDGWPDLGDELGQRQLIPAAWAIRDEQGHPREFDWPGGLKLRITSKVVVLESARPDKPGE